MLPVRSLIWRGSLSFPRSSNTKRVSFVRQYQIHHLTGSQQRASQLDNIPVCDYAILSRESSVLGNQLNPHISNITTLKDYKRNVRDLYTNERLRRFKLHRRNPIQALFCVLLHSLHYASLKDSNTVNTAKFFIRSIEEEVRHTLNMDPGSDMHDLLADFQGQSASFESQVTQLLSLYQYGSTQHASDTNLPLCHIEKVRISLAALTKHLGKFTFRDICIWISSITAQSVTSACMSLSGSSHFPSFILRDILERSPKSEYEAELILDLYKRYYHMGSSLQTLANLISSIKLYLPHEVVSLVQHILKYETRLGANDVNALMVILAEPLKNQDSNEYTYQILETQRLCVSHLHHHLMAHVTTKGLFAMTLALKDLSPARAKKFYGMGMQLVGTDEELQLAHRCKLLLSKNTSSLIQTLDSIMIDKDSINESQIWLDFFQTSQQFDLVNEHSATRFLKAQTGNPKITSSQSILFQHLTPTDIVNSCTRMDNKSLSILISKLYKHPNPIFKFRSGVDFARYIYKILNNPSRAVVSSILYGESLLRPETAYDRYKEVLEEFLDDVPTEKCLLSLIAPAYRDLKLRWENRYATQLAVHEFRKYLKRSPQDSRTLIPSNSLWGNYIMLCGVCNYQSELSEILQIWENLRYKPTRKTLGMLLGALSEDVGENLRKHGYTYMNKYGSQDLELSQTTDSEGESLGSNLWEWPTKSEVENWRRRMVRQEK